MQIYHHRSTKNLSLVFFSFLLHTIHSSSTTHFGITSSEMWNEMKWDERKKRKKCKRKKNIPDFFPLRLDSRFYRLLLLHFDVNEKKKKFSASPTICFTFFFMASSLPPSSDCVYIFHVIDMSVADAEDEDSFRFSTLAKEKFCILPEKHIPYAEMQRSVPVLMLIFM